MKLSTKAIKKLNQRTVMQIAGELGFSERWTKTQIGRNQVNGPLTTYAAVRIIRENTGMDITEILTDSRKVKKRRAAAA